MRKPRKPKWLANFERQQAAAEGEARTEAIVDAWGKLPPVKVAPWSDAESRTETAERIANLAGTDIDGGILPPSTEGGINRTPKRWWWSKPYHVQRHRDRDRAARSAKMTDFAKDKYIGLIHATRAAAGAEERLDWCQAAIEEIVLAIIEEFPLSTVGYDPSTEAMAFLAGLNYDAMKALVRYYDHGEHPVEVEKP